MTAVRINPAISQRLRKLIPVIQIPLSGIPVWIFSALITLNTFLLLEVLPQMSPVNSSVIKVDMQAEDGNFVEVYLNGAGDPLRQKTIPKQRKVYTFPGISEDIAILRLDPTDLSGKEVSIYSLEVDDNDGVLRRFGPTDLQSWTSSNLKSPAVADGAFHFFSANNDPIMVSRVNINLRRVGNARWASLVSKMLTAEFLPALIAFSFALYLIAGLFSSTRCFHLPIALAVLLALEWLVPTTVRSYHKLAAASVAVGQATFYGRSAGANQVAMILGFVAAVMSGVVVWLVVALLHKTQALRHWMDGAAADESFLPAWTRSLITGIVICLVFAIFVPNLPAILSLIRDRLFPPHWDSNNITYWSYLAHRGFLPFRDFWYTYSGFYVFALPLPTGIILRWLYMSLLFTIFFVSFYKLSAYRLSAALFAVGVMIAGDRGVLLGNSYRYLLAIDIVLSYLIIDTTRPRGTRGAIWFWLSCALALFFEPVQLVYAGAAIGGKLVLDLWQDKLRSWTAWQQRLIREFAVPLCTSVLLLVWLAARGQLAPFLRFQLSLGDMSVYAAVPTNLAEGLRNPLGLKFIVLAVPLVLIALGLFERLRRQDAARRYADGILGLGLVGFVVLQKHIIREIGPDMLSICLAGLLAYVFVWRGRRSWLEYVCASIIAGSFLFLMTQAGAAESALESLKKSPRSIADSLHLMRYEKPLLESANAAEYAHGRFARFPDELKVEAWIRQDSGGAGAQVFALTDDPILYILTGQGPVYQSNLYNASPLYEQRRLVNWLAAARPGYVTLDPSMTEWDQVPTAVRSPLVFAHVIDNYVPEQVVGRIEILRRRLPDEAIPLPYWRDKLGATLNLGRLPSVSSFSRFLPCKADSGRGCVDFLSVRLTKGHPEKKPLNIPIEAEGLPFSLQLETIPAESTYYIPLDRVWFWKTVKDHGGAIKILNANVPDGIDLQVISKEDLPDVLY